MNADRPERGVGTTPADARGVASSGNLADGLPQNRPEAETFTDLLSGPGIRIERIVSTGQSSPPGFWYDQPHDEWVIVVAGEARLRIEGEANARRLRTGDWVLLPARCRHRVDWTHPDIVTVWLAVHYGAVDADDRG